ncbi:MAG TPA: M20/M25/M40 family metallo-hydrolase [Candidatus Saccharimonadales bacterium]|nr:M20/M25/M40 family metallo-hydrolase [Candidatus Saccharimonadales bacterium]
MTDQPPAPRSTNRTEDILRDLVAFPSVTGDYAANHAAIEYIDRFLRGRGMLVQRFAWDNVESLVATTRPTKTPAVFLMGHIDVVTAPSHLFKLEHRDGKYIGRGVLDMKGPVAAYLGTVNALAPHLADYNFGIMVTTDEEVGGLHGAAKLAEAGYGAHAMVVTDGTPDWSMERLAKGIWHFTVETTGRSAHGSRPWEGENAIDKLVAVIADIKALFPEQSPDTNTMNVGVIGGGHATNQIPAAASANLDLRFVSVADQHRLTRQVLDIVERHGATLTYTVKADAVESDPANPYLAAYVACTERVIGRPVKWVTSNAASDARWFALRGIPCAVSYPRGGDHHGPSEWIGDETLAQMEQIYGAFLHNIARVRKSAGRHAALTR